MTIGKNIRTLECMAIRNPIHRVFKLQIDSMNRFTLTPIDKLRKQIQKLGYRREAFTETKPTYFFLIFP